MAYCHMSNHTLHPLQYVHCGTNTSSSLGCPRDRSTSCNSLCNADTLTIPLASCVILEHHHSRFYASMLFIAHEYTISACVFCIHCMYKWYTHVAQLPTRIATHITHRISPWLLQLCAPPIPQQLLGMFRIMRGHLSSCHVLYWRPRCCLCAQRWGVVHSDGRWALEVGVGHMR